MLLIALRVLTTLIILRLLIALRILTAFVYTYVTYYSLEWESILHGNAGELGDYKELTVLPDKIARYLYEFHAECYASHGLPPLPDDRSDTNVHGILNLPQASAGCTPAIK